MTLERDNALNRRYREDGFLFPLPAMSRGEAARHVAALEAHEARIGGPLLSNQRHQVHLLFTWADELIRLTPVLDAVEQLIGPDILCWVTNFFIKEPKDGNFVSWHQDSTYWGLEPLDDVVTAWIALSDAPLESGAMKFLPGSHRWGQQVHNDTYHENNLLSRGQQLDTAIDESRAVDIVLSAGEFSLHHVLLAHGSHPNISDNRRIGLAVRYIPTSARQTKIRDAAVLVRGEDRYGHFDLMSGPERDLDEAALAAHADASERLVAAVYSGTDKTEMRA